MLTWLVVMQEAEPVMAPDAVLPVLLWQHPPATLPTPPRGVGLPEAPTMSLIAFVPWLPSLAVYCAMHCGEHAYLLLSSSMLLLAHTLTSVLATDYATHGGTVPCKPAPQGGCRSA